MFEVHVAFSAENQKINLLSFCGQSQTPISCRASPCIVTLWQHVILWEIAILIERNNIQALGECQRCSCSGDMQWIMLMQWIVWSRKVNVSLTLYRPRCTEGGVLATVGIMMLDRGWQSLLHLSHECHQLQAAGCGPALSAHTFKYGLTPQWRN